MNCPTQQSFVPAVFVNGQVRPMPAGGVLSFQHLQTPAWAYRVRSASIADSTELGRKLITAQTAEEARGYLQITQTVGTPVVVTASGALARTDTSEVVLDLVKTRAFIDTDYDALVTTLLGQ